MTGALLIARQDASFHRRAAAVQCRAETVTTRTRRGCKTCGWTTGPLATATEHFPPRGRLPLVRVRK